MQYAYYWVCNDLLCPDIIKADKLISQVYEQNVDCLLINTFYALSKESAGEEDYYVCKGNPDFFTENIDKAVATGGILVSANLANEMVTAHSGFENAPFWHINALAESFEHHAIRCVAISEWLFLYNERPPYFCVSDFARNTMVTWTKDWHIAIGALPECYYEYQSDLLSLDDKEYMPLFLKNLIYWRVDGTYNLKIYNQMKPYIADVTQKSMRAMMLVALAPKCFSKWIIKHINGRIVRGCIAFYRVCVLKKEE